MTPGTRNVKTKSLATNEHKVYKERCGKKESQLNVLNVRKKRNQGS